MHADPLPGSVQQTIDNLARYEMMTPAALFVAGHRPLAFVVGQLCHGLAPFGALLGIAVVQEWAIVLSDPAATDRMLEALHDAA